MSKTNESDDACISEVNPLWRSMADVVVVVLGYFKVQSKKKLDLS